MNAVAQRIQVVLDDRKLKLKPVAEAAGVKYYSIYPWWQRESAKPDYEKVKLIASYLSIPVGHFMYGDAISGTAPTAENLASRIETLEDLDRSAVEKFLDYLVSNRERDRPDQLPD